MCNQKWIYTRRFWEPIEVFNSNEQTNALTHSVQSNSLTYQIDEDDFNRATRSCVFNFFFCLFCPLFRAAEHVKFCTLGRCIGCYFFSNSTSSQGRKNKKHIIQDSFSSTRKQYSTVRCLPISPSDYNYFLTQIDVISTFLTHPDSGWVLHRTFVVRQVLDVSRPRR